MYSKFTQEKVSVLHLVKPCFRLHLTDEFPAARSQVVQNSLALRNQVILNDTSCFLHLKCVALSVSSKVSSAPTSDAAHSDYFHDLYSQIISTVGD